MSWRGNFGQANYVAVKAGIVSPTRIIALETARNGITANAIAPGRSRHRCSRPRQRLLLKHRIGEPTSYTTQFSAESGTWAASTAGDPEELVHLALSGEMVAALRLCRFTETALCAWDTEAAAILGIRNTQISREYAYLTKSLGTEIFIRIMCNGPRVLTPTSSALYNLARANIDKLRQVASYEPPRAD